MSDRIFVLAIQAPELMITLHSSGDGAISTLCSYLEAHFNPNSPVTAYRKRLLADARQALPDLERASTLIDTAVEALSLTWLIVERTVDNKEGLA